MIDTFRTIGNNLAVIAQEPKRVGLKTLHIQNIGCFEDAKFDFCGGINVLMGENGSGKTQVMKLGYAVTKACQNIQNTADLSFEIRRKVIGVFRPDDSKVDRLIRRTVGNSTATVTSSYQQAGTSQSSWSRKDDTWKTTENPTQNTPNAIFLPSREALSLYEGFVSLYENRELSFSEVYRDLCVALSTPLLKGARAQEANLLLRPLLEAIGGSVRNKNGRFYVDQKRAGNIEAHLLAEGLRKLASLAHLVNNGSLGKQDILFWDEPEANLNPRFTAMVCDFLIALAKQGVQVILASHDYLLTRRLGALDEYSKDKDFPGIKFFSLYKDGEDSSKSSLPSQVESAEKLGSLEHDSILDEHANFYDFEQELSLR